MATTDILVLLQREARALEARLGGIRGAIAALTGATSVAATKRTRKVSAAQRKAQSLKMKAYWAKKKAGAKK
jgi:hypothetical protein